MDIDNKNLGFIGKRLKALRVENKYTVEEMAKLLDVSVRAYRSYEKSERDPSTMSLAILAVIFGISANYLIGVSDDPYITSDTAPPQVDFENLKHDIINSIDGIKTTASLIELASYIEYLLNKEKQS